VTRQSRFNKWIHPTAGDKVAQQGYQLDNTFTSIDATVAIIQIPAVGYGAIGDGTTNDTAALQAAAADCRAIPGSTLALESNKTYVITAPIDCTGINLRMNGSTIRMAAGIQATNIITSTGGLGIIGPGTLDGNRANNTNPGVNTSGAGIYANTLTAANSVDLFRVNVINCWQRGIHLNATGSGTSGSQATNLPVALRQCSVSGSGTYGYFLSRIGGLQMQNCSATNNGAAGVYVNLCATPLISGGMFNNNPGNSTHGITIMYCFDACVVGVTANNNGASGVTFGGGNATLTPNARGQIIGCSINFNAASGITIDPTISGQSGVPQVWNGTVTGNICNSNAVHGILTTAVSRAAIVGNTCQGNTASGVTLNSSNFCTVTGNSLISNNNGLGINAGSAAPGGGFYGRHTISGNNFSTNTTGRLQSSGLQWHEQSSASLFTGLETMGTAAPTTGTWAPGDKCWNSAPAGSAPMGWICTIGGTPGTWAPMPNIAS
jgi:parallel beta-helix repeat protein